MLDERNSRLIVTNDYTITLTHFQLRGKAYNHTEKIPDVFGKKPCIAAKNVCMYTKYCKLTSISQMAQSFASNDKKMIKNIMQLFRGWTERPKVH